MLFMRIYGDMFHSIPIISRNMYIIVYIYISPYPHILGFEIMWGYINEMSRIFRNWEHMLLICI